MDELPENAFFNVGTIDEAIAKDRGDEDRNPTVIVRECSMANTFLAGDPGIRPSRFYCWPRQNSWCSPTVDGLMGILPGHESMVTVVSPGELKYLVDGQWHYAAISDGFAEVRRDYVLVLGDAIELPEEIDAKRAAEAAERAKERLLHKQSIMQYYHSQAALNRAMNRLKISKRHNHEI